MSLQNEAVLRQKLQNMERQLQQAQEDHQKEQQAREAEIQRLQQQNEELVKEKDRIMQDHIQEAYLTNLNLHRRSTELEAALQRAETLLGEKAQQVRELEDIPNLKEDYPQPIKSGGCLYHM